MIKSERRSVLPIAKDFSLQFIIDDNGYPFILVDDVINIFGVEIKKDGSSLAESLKSYISKAIFVDVIPHNLLDGKVYPVMSGSIKKQCISMGVFTFILLGHCSLLATRDIHENTELQELREVCIKSGVIMERIDNYSNKMFGMTMDEMNNPSNKKVVEESIRQVKEDMEEENNA